MAATYINQDVVNLYESAGICPPYDSKTVSAVKSNKCVMGLKEYIKRQLRVIDEQDAVTRYTWDNLPLDITSQELERMIYYKGQLCFFYFKELEKFFIMPYALDGTIDFYGRFNYVKPVPFASGTDGKEDKQIAKQAALLSTLRLKVLYDIPTEPYDPNENYCVLLHDYTKQISQTMIPRQQLQDGLLDVMSDCIPFMRTALLNSTGIQGMRVSNQDEQSNVKAASKSINQAALNGEKYVAIIGGLDFQDLTSGATSKGEEFLMAMQSLDNFRLSTYGLENGGLFEKKQYQNTAQTALNGNGQVGNPLYDGLAIRQHFCDIVNIVWNCGVSCDISEVASGADNNADGNIYDSENTEESADSQEEITEND